MAQNQDRSSAINDDAGQPGSGIFAKLQLLFPSLPSPKRTTTPPPSNPESTSDTRKSKFVKVHIITWNMHDSLPKGNLKDLLGFVPAYVERKINNDDERFHLPNLTLEDEHPYHIVVVGGQECPTLSGIPMGLAANFKHKEHKDSNNRDSDKAKFKGKGIEHLAEPMSPTIKQEHHHLNHHRHRTDGGALLPTTSGWSAVLEDWFSNGLGSLSDVKPVVTSGPAEGAIPSTTETGTSAGVSSSIHQPNVIDVNWEGIGSSDCSSQINHSSRNPFHKGPYQLLVKERLMGIYMAVFVHRDIYPLIEGVSTDTVPAGLIGGRLGNKGGVGVSVNLNGTTMLFINAHLAAHDGNVALRVANLSKIKAELSVEPFLPPTSSRLLKEDLTDKFDYTWIFGDLNFRLDITRLHADWLITRKEFNQALAFDQLNKLLKSQEPALNDFQEAEIAFPPTFKYDVPHKRHRFHRHKIGDGDILNNEDMGDTPDVTGSASSMSSEMSFLNLREPSARPLANTVLLHIVSTTKSFFGALRKPIGPKNRKSHKRGTLVQSRGTSPSALSRSSGTGFHGNTPRFGKRSSFFPYVKKRGLANGYDSSSKQRVPSWCDRILWRTTVKPEEANLPNDPRIRNTRFGRMLRPFRGYTADNYISTPTPKVSSKSMSPSPELKSRTASFDLRRRPSGERNNRVSGSAFSNLRPRSISIDGGYYKELDLRSDGLLNPDATASRTVPKVPAGTLPGPSLVGGGSPRRWLPQFLTKEPHELALALRSNSLKVKRDVKSTPRRGELVCRSYHTLDDEQMVRLGGWSDHRPVIGTYAIFL